MDVSALYTQIAEMILLMCIGFYCCKRQLITENGSAQMSSLLLNFALPCVLIHSFCREFDKSMLRQLVLTLVLSLIILAISIAIAAVLFPKSSPDYADKRMCMIFSNNAFMAIPLLQALYGNDGVFIGSINIVATNILTWTFGIWLLTRASGNTMKTNWRRIAFNPGTIGFVIGLVIFLTSFQLPTVVSDTISFVANLNTPLSMIVLGVYLAQSDLKSLIRDRSSYLVCAGRLVLIPLVTIALLYFLPFDRSIGGVLIVSVATPCAVASSMFAQLCETNYHYASRMIALSTLLSAISMPVMLSLYQMVLG